MERGHSNRRAIEEKATQRVRLESLRTPSKNPFSQLVFVHYEFREIGAIPRRDVALEAAGVAAGAAPARSVAAKAAQSLGDRVSVQRHRILGDVGGSQRAKVGHEISHLGVRKAPTPGWHPYRRRIEVSSEFRALPDAQRHAIEDPLAERYRVDVIEILKPSWEQRRRTCPSVAPQTALGQDQIGAALNGADIR